MPKIDKMWAFTYIDDNGMEGIVNYNPSPALQTPLVTGSKMMLPRMTDAARQMAKKLNKEIRVKEFEFRALVGVIGKDGK